MATTQTMSLVIFVIAIQLSTASSCGSLVINCNSGASNCYSGPCASFAPHFIGHNRLPVVTESFHPINIPSHAPTQLPTSRFTSFNRLPTVKPTQQIPHNPTNAPYVLPAHSHITNSPIPLTLNPIPSHEPTLIPTLKPTAIPTLKPITTVYPSQNPTTKPSSKPTDSPLKPTPNPTAKPKAKRRQDSDSDSSSDSDDALYFNKQFDNYDLLQNDNFEYKKPSILFSTNIIFVMIFVLVLPTIYCVYYKYYLLYELDRIQFEETQSNTEPPCLFDGYNGDENDSDDESYVM